MTDLKVPVFLPHEVYLAASVAVNMDQLRKVLSVQGLIVVSKDEHHTAPQEATNILQRKLQVAEEMNASLNADYTKLLQEHVKEIAELRRALDATIQPLTDFKEWKTAAATVGVHGPGNLQQAKLLAVAATESLGFNYDTTSPADIRERMEILMRVWARLSEIHDDFQRILP